MKPKNKSLCPVKGCRREPRSGDTLCARCLDRVPGSLKEFLPFDKKLQREVIDGIGLQLQVIYGSSIP